MNDDTSEPRACKICGDPLRSDNNAYGICSNKAKPECWRARSREYRLRKKASTPESAKPQRRRCELCGNLLRSSNIYGVCSRTPACSRESYVRARRAKGHMPRQRRLCGHPGGCPDPGRYGGYCSMHRQRLHNTGELGPVESKRKPAGSRIAPGDRFGHWVAVGEYDISSAAVRCRCDCGAERPVAAKSLLGRRSRSCGCFQRSVASRPRSSGAYLRSGQVFARLTVLEDVLYARELVRVRCECGTETSKPAAAVKNGNTKSCGCLYGEIWRTHGLSKHPLYGIWRGIIGRTTDPDNAAYANYGGRGITLCERWRSTPDGLLNFAADMGARPGPEYSVDRTNNDGPYSPDNCTWEDKATQSKNRRKVSVLTRERDALAARLAEVERRLSARKQAPVPQDHPVLF